MSYRPRSNDGDNVRRLRHALGDAARPEVERYLDDLAAKTQAGAQALGERPRIPAALFDVEAAVLGPVRHELDRLEDLEP